MKKYKISYYRGSVKHIEQTIESIEINADSMDGKDINEEVNNLISRHFK